MRSSKFLIPGMLLLSFAAFLYANGKTDTDANDTTAAQQQAALPLADTARQPVPAGPSTLRQRLADILPAGFGGSDLQCTYQVQYLQDGAVQQSFGGILHSGDNFFIDSNQHYISIKLGAYMFTLDPGTRSAFYIDGNASLGAPFTRFGMDPVAVLHDSAFYVQQDEALSYEGQDARKITILPRDEAAFIREATILYAPSAPARVYALQMRFDNEKLNGDTGGTTLMTLKDFEFEKRPAATRFPYISIVGNEVALVGAFRDYRLSPLQ